MSLRDELVQVAAVALRWINVLDHGHPGGPDHNNRRAWHDLIAEVNDEMDRADHLFPEMRHSERRVWLSALIEEVGEVARCLNETTIAGWRSADEDR